MTTLFDMLVLCKTMIKAFGVKLKVWVSVRKKETPWQAETMWAEFSAAESMFPKPGLLSWPYSLSGINPSQTMPCWSGTSWLLKDKCCVVAVEVRNVNKQVFLHSLTNKSLRISEAAEIPATVNFFRSQHFWLSLVAAGLWKEKSPCS